MSTDRCTILLAIADSARAEFLGDQLTADGFEIVCADHTAMAIRSLHRSYPDAVIVETRLPDRPGLELIAELRAGGSGGSRVDPATPVIALTERADPLERVRALERGADDVIGGELHYPELLARLRGALRRVDRGSGDALVRVGALELDPVARRVVIGGQRVELSQKEYALLRALAAEPTRVFSKDELLRSVWGFRTSGRTRTLDSHACRLRQKLARHGGEYVINVWGVGYRLVDGPPSATPVAGRPTALQALTGGARSELAAA